MSQKSDHHDSSNLQQNAGPFGCDRNAGGSGRPAPNLLDHLADPVVTFDKQWRCTFLNARTCQALGKTPEDLIGTSIGDLFPEEYQNGFREACERAWSEGKPSHYESYSKVLGAWVNAHICPLEDGALAQWQDITDRKRMEQALRESEARLRTVSDNLPEAAIYRYSPAVDGKPHFDFISAGLERLTGVPASEVMNDAGVMDRAIVPEDFERMEEATRISAERLTPFEFEVRFRHQRTGEIRWSLLRSVPKRNPDGLTSWDGIQLDITERKRAEAALRESEERYRGIVELAEEGIAIHDPDGAITYVNQRMADMLGYSREELIGKSSLDFLDDLEKKDVIRGGESMKQHVILSKELKLHRKDGSVLWTLANITPRRDSAGNFVGYLAMHTDVTERKKAEDRLRQSQKLESIGLLAGGIAHDFNNLLTGVMGNASLLLEDAAPERAETLRSIIASTERAAHLTRQLLAYSGKGQFIVRELDVTQAVNEMADLVQFSIPKSVSLALTLERRLPFVAMDPGQLQQVLMNLVINAGEAIGDGNPGRIAVTTSMAHIQASFTDELGEEIAPGRYICIEVRDTGSGIDPEKKAKIFDPFFTTKFVGRGLGLAAIAGILRSQKGGIIVESALGKGSTFTVFLPAAGKTGLAVQDPEPQDGRPVFLVVDDEVAVREFISAVLRRMGYQVVQASDGQEALAVCGSAPGAIGAAIVDIIMPNMSANDLLAALKARQPDMRILLTSGYSEAEARRLCAAYPGADFIQKPYTAQQLARAVDELVAASAS